MNTANSVQPTSMDKFLIYYSSVGVFLFFALSMVVPSGYSYGPVLLLIPSLYFIFKKSTYKDLSKGSKLLISAFLIYSTAWLLEIIYHKLGSRGIDRPFKFVIAVFVFLYLLKYPPKQIAVWLGIAAGATATGVFAIWVKTTTGISRVEGYTNTIQYGNLSMLLGLLSLTGIVWASNQSKFKKTLIAIMLSGFVLGLSASLLSGSRGGWIGAPLIILYIIYSYRSALNKYFLISLVGIIISAIAFISTHPQSGVSTRISQVKNDLVQYSEGNSRTSVGTRLELWKGSYTLFLERPILGFGGKNFDTQIERLISEKKMQSVATKAHSHNEFLYQAFKFGIIGIASLLALYLLPLLAFKKEAQKALRKEMLALPIAGITVVISYIDFGLTQAFFSHNSGIMFYPLSLIILWSTLKSAPDTNA